MTSADERSSEPRPGGERPWHGLRVLVTAGGTREPIDPVRFIGNRSSGRMGLALAAAAGRRGAEVTLIAANVALPEPPGVRRLDVETTAELADAVRAEFRASHLLLMAAAPADFRAAEVSTQKLSRENEPSSGAAGFDHTGAGSKPDARSLRLVATEDILGGLEKGEGQTVVAFAAEHGAGGLERAREKLVRKNADLVVFNDVSDPAIGFDSTDNAVTLIDASGDTSIPLSSKTAIADAILDRVERLRRPNAKSGLY